MIVAFPFSLHNFCFFEPRSEEGCISINIFLSEHQVGNLLVKCYNENTELFSNHKLLNDDNVFFVVLFITWKLVVLAPLKQAL